MIKAYWLQNSYKKNEFIEVFVLKYGLENSSLKLNNSSIHVLELFHKPHDVLK